MSEDYLYFFDFLKKYNTMARIENYKIVLTQSEKVLSGQNGIGTGPNFNSD